MSNVSATAALSVSALGNQRCRQWVGADCIDAWRRDAGPDARLDVALITHPRDEQDFLRLFPAAAGLDAAAIRAMTRELGAGFAEVSRAHHLTIGILFLPLYADEMLGGSASSALSILGTQGLATAACCGARIVSLGGLTGALSLYGEALVEQAGRLGLRIATGHCTTAVSVVRTLRRVWRELGRSADGTQTAILGLGSVGAASYRLLLRDPGKDRRIVLIDRPARRRRLERLAEEARRFGVPTRIEVSAPGGELLPDSNAYHADVLISAISSAYVVDIGRLAPFTVLIDDSQPYCWSRAEAWARCNQHHDLVPCEAGLVDCGSLGYASRLPFDFAGQEYGTGIAWSCLVEAMLCAIDPALVPTTGEPVLDNLCCYDAAFDRFGLEVPSLQCAPHVLPMEALRRAFATGAAASVATA